MIGDHVRDSLKKTYSGITPWDLYVISVINGLSHSIAHGDTLVAIAIEVADGLMAEREKRINPKL